MNDQTKETVQKGALSRIDSLSLKELREYAKIVTMKNEQYKFKLKCSNEAYKKMQCAYQRLKGRFREYQDKLETRENGCASKEQEPTLRPQEDEQQIDHQGKNGETLDDDAHTPVSETQMTMAGPSDLRLADWPDNTSQKTIEATPVDQSIPNRIVSPAWESIKKKSRIYKKDEQEEVPAPERVEGAYPGLDHDASFKYLEVIRKQDERAKLPAGFCVDCAKFYKAYAEHGDLRKANELVKRLCGHNIHQQTSRHRRKYEPPPTPPDFWDIKPLEPDS